MTPWQIAEALRGGGAWLGAARGYLQRHCVNGDRLIWGSSDAVNLTVREIEDMALMIAAAAIGQDAKHLRLPDNATGSP